MRLVTVFFVALLATCMSMAQPASATSANPAIPIASTNPPTLIAANSSTSANTTTRPGPGASANGEPDVRLIVKLKNDTMKAASVVEGSGGHVVGRVSNDTVVVSFPGALTATAMTQLQTRDDVAWVEPDIEYRASRIPNDPCLTTTCAGMTQWGLEKVRASAAWDVTTGRSNITVGVLDSGVDATHPDLQGHVTVGPNYSADTSTLDELGHGTHIAGVIGARTNNGIGIAGVAWDVSVLSIKVLDASGIGSASSVSQGLRYAADRKVNIVNLSFGGSYSQAIAEAVAYAQSRGVLVIAAADNQASTNKVYPAALPNVLAVGASMSNDSLASFSNRGQWVDLLAPGTAIVSTFPTNLAPSTPYVVMQGTSMASPLVVGAAALVWSERPYLSAAGVAELLTSTAARVAGTGTIVQFGRLDVGAALTSLREGYRLVASDGGIFAFDESFEGSTGGLPLNKPIVGAASPGNASGYWLVASDGGVFAFGDADFHGSLGGRNLNAPIVAAAGTRSGEGYWMAASDGGVFSFGDAAFYGSTGGMLLNKPIVAFLPTLSGQGYWLVASDGGVFSFGDAVFEGSTGGMSLNKPIVGAARTPSGQGYWLVASDGGVFSFGDARFYGSTGGMSLNKPIVGIIASPTGLGYWLVASDGGVFSFGDAQFHGSTGALALNKPIITAL